MKPFIPSGTRDFGPEQVNKRNYIVDIIKKGFVKYGYQPIETPAMEALATLTGKYGEEGDQLLFKILNSGEFTKDIKSPDELKDWKKLAFSICDRGLRYDLTVPFARYVVMNQNDITFPFKRYQIQPVWRGDRPQKGRYREFWQCDADVVGSPSLFYETELILLLDEVFAELGFPVTLKFNNRKILAGLAEAAGIADKMMSMTIAIDKLDKIGMEGVRKEMDKNGIPAEAIDAVEKLLMAKDIESLKPLLASSETGLKGIAEMEEVYQLLSLTQLKNKLVFDVTLARGLNYYTGAIFEVSADNVQMGSISGGGRYDDLTGLFGLKGVSGVGISFGLDRIYDVMDELKLFPPTLLQAPQILIATFDKKSFVYGFQCLMELRGKGIRAELYPAPTKMQKQMQYANDRNIPFVAIIGDAEMEAGEVMLKDMAAGTQERVAVGSINF